MMTCSLVEADLMGVEKKERKEVEVKDQEDPLQKFLHRLSKHNERVKARSEESNENCQSSVPRAVGDYHSEPVSVNVSDECQSKQKWSTASDDPTEDFVLRLASRNVHAMSSDNLATETISSSMTPFSENIEATVTENSEQGSDKQDSQSTMNFLKKLEAKLAQGDKAAPDEDVITKEELNSFLNSLAAVGVIKEAHEQKSEKPLTSSTPRTGSDAKVNMVSPLKKLDDKQEGRQETGCNLAVSNPSQRLLHSYADPPIAGQTSQQQILQATDCWSHWGSVAQLPNPSVHQLPNLTETQQYYYHPGVQQNQTFLQPVQYTAQGYPHPGGMYPLQHFYRQNLHVQQPPFMSIGRGFPQRPFNP